MWSRAWVALICSRVSGRKEVCSQPLLPYRTCTSHGIDSRVKRWWVAHLKMAVVKCFVVLFRYWQWILYCVCVFDGWSDLYFSCFPQCRTRMMRTWKGPGKELCELANEVRFEALNRCLWPFTTLIRRSRCSALCGETLKICFDPHYEPLSDLCICSITSYTKCCAPYDQTFTDFCRIWMPVMHKIQVYWYSLRRVR